VQLEGKREHLEHLPTDTGNNMPTYSVPRSVRSTAAKAIEYNLSLPISRRASYKTEGKERVPGTGIRTARRLVRGKVDEDQIRLMVAWFARHGESDKEAEARQDKTSKASIAWALWGGNKGRQWARAVLRTIKE
jgi:hypothetical protein